MRVCLIDGLGRNTRVFDRISAASECPESATSMLRGNFGKFDVKCLGVFRVSKLGEWSGEENTHKDYSLYMVYFGHMKWGMIGLLVAVLVGGVALVRYLAAPIPGTHMPDQGREHVTKEQVASTQYNSNPPTSGPHLPTWVRPGIYTEPQEEGELIHSLEHGYIIISYASAAAQLVPQLEDTVRKKGLKKLIVVSRPQLDAPIALTAWTYIDKMNEFDAERIERFIDFHRDHGPEQTME
jgi:hypothetical protein